MSAEPAEPAEPSEPDTETGRSRTLDVVVPLYREAEGLRNFHRVLTSQLNDLNDRYDWNVVYVADPSPDATADIVRELASRDRRVRGVVMLRRAGHQMSLIAGMEWSTADAVITMDGDLQHPPALIPQLLEHYEAGVDVVQTIRTRSAGRSRLGGAMSRGFYRVIRGISDVPITEGGADFRLLSARAVRILTAEVRESDRFIRGLVPWMGLPTATVEFEAPAREHGTSKYNLARSLDLAGSGVVSFSKAPLHLAMVLGLIVSGLGLLIGIAALLARLAGSNVPAGWATLVVMVAVLSGVQLVCIGFIGLYLGVVFDEAKRRPQILVEEYVSSSEDPHSGKAPTASRRIRAVPPRTSHPALDSCERGGSRVSVAGGSHGA
ncbi:glycosyltransferase [Xylanimonas allomyrinae]|uniref:Glycosyltransferase n=1 Tax=Xylanimonas allomyrinae TaxID=2509459 RepID=A0A4V0YE92_9MICO|nr:glycosyltransferase family 2 protein [Xylanimonas allomyrinae]QAY63401.1 glycosyltransferase [Xylanimonas allomyrinae]